MTKARQNANISPAVGRNMVINGAMNVSQRATSVTGLVLLQVILLVIGGKQTLMLQQDV